MLCLKHCMEVSVDYLSYELEWEKGNSSGSDVDMLNVW